MLTRVKLHTRAPYLTLTFGRCFKHNVYICLSRLIAAATRLISLCSTSSSSSPLTLPHVFFFLCTTLSQIQLPIVSHHACDKQLPTKLRDGAEQDSYLFTHPPSTEDYFVLRLDLWIYFHFHFQFLILVPPAGT